MSAPLPSFSGDATPTAGSGADLGADSATARTLTPLTEPSDGVPPVVDTSKALDAVIERFAAAEGPIAVDAERASGYRYSQRAYLIQLKRRGAGIALIDPIALPHLDRLEQVIGGQEWVLHAASQDLPCLADVGLRPARVFDTELAARLLGYPRVGLATVVGELLGLGLAKEHSAVDWSTRPLSQDWLAYAALDVEVLIEVRDLLEDQLAQAGKYEWALQEFDAVRDAPPHPARVDPWRRVSGIHAIKNRKQLAVVRELWLARDKIARDRDTAPGRIVPDIALIEAAQRMPRTERELAQVKAFGRARRRRDLATYLGAIKRGESAPESAYPPIKAPASGGPPPTKVWRDRDPVAAKRLARVRAALADASERLAVPVENLAPPAAIRALCWQPPTSQTDPTADAEAGTAPEALITAVREQLGANGARPWQAELVADLVTPLL